MSPNTIASYPSSESISTNNGDTTPCTITDLEEDTPYNIKVQATTNNNGMSAIGKELSIRTDVIQIVRLL